MSTQFPLLEQQKGLIFHQAYGDVKSAYINHVVIVFDEAVSVEALKTASELLVRDFSILRAHVDVSNHVWVVNDEVTADFEYRVLADSPDSVDTLLATNRADIQFDVSKPPLISFRLFQVAPASFYFVISYHHALLAGRCAVETLDHLLVNYDRLLAGRPLLEAPKDNYVALVQRINAIDTSDADAKLRGYFEKMIEPTQLPQQSGTSSTDNDLSTLSLTSDIRQWQSIQTYCRQLKMSPNLFFHLAWSLTLSWYVPQDTLCFGTTREFPRGLTKGHAGFFMSTMPLVVTLTQKTSIHSVIADLKAQHRLFPQSVFIPYNVIRSYTHLHNNMSLFDSVIDFKPYSPGAVLQHRHPSWQHRHVHFRFKTHYPCFIEIYQDESGTLRHRFRYQSADFSAEWMQQLVQHYQQMIKQLIQQHDLALPARQLRPYTDTDLTIIHNQLTGPTHSLEADQSIWSCITLQAQRHPQHKALTCANDQLTYAELVAAVERVACFLKAKLALAVGDIIFVDLERTLQLPIIVLALHRMGVCFVPVNVALMSHDLSDTMHFTGATALITDRPSNTHTMHCSIKTLIVFKSTWKNLTLTHKKNTPPSSLPPYKTSLNALFYIMFTSGTTGKPKGVRVSQKNVMHVLNALQAQLSLTSEDCFLALSDYIFDIAYLELLLPLITGGHCVIGTACEKQNRKLIMKRIQQHRVTLMQATPTYWRYLLASKTITRPSHSLTVISGGELLDRACAKRLLAFGTTVWNAYGPTETTIWSSLHRITQQDIDAQHIPIGLPIANTTFHILNPYQQPLPQGVPGELYISGLGVAEGYVTTDSNKATDSFVHLTVANRSPCRAYRTGDKVCLTHKGKLLFYCRYDEQIKLHGHRIELPHIENTLMQHPLISAGAIKMAGLTPRQYLVAYVVSQRPMTEASLRDFLKKTLPDYMIPSQYVFLKALPHTAQGKVDKTQLALPQTKSTYDDFSPNESVMRHIWSQTLDVPLNEIKSESHFFQLGGHSLTAALVVQTVNKQFNVALPVKMLFEASTLHAFTACLDTVEKANPSTSAIPKTSLKDIPLSDQQARLWTYERLQPGTSLYNMFVAFELKGPLHVKRLRDAFQSIVQKHAVLRTTIHEKGGKPIQIVHKDNSYVLTVLDWRNKKTPLTAIKKRLQQQAYTLAQHSFQLDKERPLIVQLIQCEAHYFVLLINVHHIACDGWSLRLLLSDLHHLYAQQSPQSTSMEYPAAYPDFAAWQHSQRTAAYLKTTKQYWMQYLQNAQLAVLPYDKNPLKNAKQSGTGKRVRFTVGKPLSQKIRQFCQQHQCTPFVSMITVFATLLYRYTLIDRLIFYTVSDGRLASSTHSIVGFFSNILPIVFDFSDPTDFPSAIQVFADQLSKTLTHQSVPWEILQQALPISAVEDSTGNKKLLFVQQDTLEHPIQWEGIKAKRLFSDNETLLLSDYDSSKFDICVYVQWTQDECIGLVEYNTEKFYADTINDFINNYQTLLESLITLPSQSITTAPFSLQAHPRPLPIQVTSDHLNYYPNVIESLSRRCQQQPDNHAIVYQDDTITYQDLWERTEVLAYALLTHINSPHCIAVCLPTTLDTLLLLIAIMRTGCPYLPIDPEQPNARIEAILNDARPQALIVDANQSLSNLPCRRINADDVFHHGASPANATIVLPPITAYPPLAYLLYTSGSTGKPKGVQVSHRNLSHMLSAGEALFTFSDKPTTWSLIHSLGFDFSVWEMWGALLSGGTLVIIPRDDLYHAQRFLKTLVKQHVSVLNITPSLFSLCLATLSTAPLLMAELSQTLKTIILGGESMIHGSLDLWFQSSLSKHVALFNMYGITEGTIHATCYPVTYNTPLHRSLIGSAIPGMATHVLDAHAYPVPTGVIGELHLEGYGVTLGYLNPPPNDQHRFWALMEHNGSSRRLFRTGDLVRRLSSGMLEYIGRKDEQLCLRGYRVELAELRQACRDFPAVDAVYLDVIDSDGQTTVNAYVTVHKDNDKLPLSTLQSHHIHSWQTLYNQIYKTPQDNPTFNTAGWCNSATGTLIPDIEMREWRDLTLEKIKSLYDTTSRVAEIGCGTGLLLFAIAPEVGTYSGIDISETAITDLKKHLASYPWSNTVTLSIQEATTFLSDPSDVYDLIIFNSVIQYFPSANYLWDVMNHAIDAVSPNGTMFIGDIRNLYRQSLYQRYANRNKGAANPLLSDEELLVDPRWFYYFCLQHPRVNYVKIDYKAGIYSNEMNYFRYDVVMGIERKDVPTSPTTMKVLPWENLSLTDLSKQLHDSPTATRMTHIPYRDLCELDSMRANNDSEKSLSSPIVPHDLVRLANTLHWRLILPWSVSNAMTEFDAILYPQHDLTQVDTLFYIPNNPSIPCSASNLRQYCNDPLHHMRTYHLKTVLTEHLKQSVPHYMQPNHIAIVPRLPLTLNGKIDRQTLRTMHTQPLTAFKQQLPLTALEADVGMMWRHLLKQDTIERDSDFFALGGHSLLAIQLLSDIETQYQVILPIQDLYKASTLSTFCQRLSDGLLQKVLPKMPKKGRSLKNASIITFQADGQDVPLFLIHPLGGTVFVYLDLLRHLQVNRPIYAIQDPGITQPNTPYTSLVALAREYRVWIQSIQPKGPYYLAGSSLGGTLAYEIAYQLEQDGCADNCIIMFDSWALYTEDFHDRKRLKTGLMRQYHFIKQKLGGVNLPQAKALMDLNYQRLKLVLQYCPPVLNQVVWLYKSMTLRKEFIPIDEPTNHWKRYCHGIIHTVPSPGDHETLLVGDNAKQLAQHLQTVLGDSGKITHNGSKDTVDGITELA